MFDRYKLNKRLKEKYDEIILLNKKQKELIENFKRNCKSYKVYGDIYSKEIIDYVVEVINSTTNLNDFSILEDNFYLIEDNLPTIKQTDLYSSYKTILNIIRRRFVANKSEFLKTDTTNSYNVFEILNKTHDFNNAYSILKSDSIYNTLLSNDKLTSDLAILYTHNILLTSNNATFINTIYDFIVRTSDAYVKNILLKILKSGVNLSDKVENKIILIINSLDNKNINKSLFNRFINLLFVERNYELQIYNFDIETIDLIINNINCKNEDLLFEVISHNAFNDIEDFKLKKEMISTISKIDIPDEEYKENIYKVITDIIIMNKDMEYANYVLKKLESIKSNESLVFLRKIHPIIEEYSTKDNKKEVINTFVQNERPKKLEIVLK